MDSEETPTDGAALPVAPGVPRAGRTRLSRRQAIGRMSAVATAGAAAWVVPEILTAKPAAGATLSGGTTGGGGTSGGVTTGANTTGSSGGAGTTGANGTNGADGSGVTDGTDGVATDAATTPTALAFTGLDIKRDAEVGAALIAGGWAMQHWASRTPKVAADGAAGPYQAGTAGDPD
ncbi:MAG: hypothetical protein ACLQU9_06620 [Acidimicrobiales bacterium]|jgi:hypothetical protein